MHADFGNFLIQSICISGSSSSQGSPRCACNDSVGFRVSVAISSLNRCHIDSIMFEPVALLSKYAPGIK